MKRVLFYLIQNCAPAVGGSLCSVGWVNPGFGKGRRQGWFAISYFGACCKSQKACVGFGFSIFIWLCSSRGELSARGCHFYNLVDKLCQHSLYKSHFY